MLIMDLRKGQQLKFVKTTHNMVSNSVFLGLNSVWFPIGRPLSSVVWSLAGKASSFCISAANSAKDSTLWLPLYLGESSAT